MPIYRHTHTVAKQLLAAHVRRGLLLIPTFHQPQVDKDGFIGGGCKVLSYQEFDMPMYRSVVHIHVHVCNISEAIG